MLAPPSPPLRSGFDNDSGTDKQHGIEVRLATGPFVLTGDLVFRVEFEPELVVH